MQVIGGMTALDEAVLRNMGDEALGIITTCWYSAELDAKPNQTFAPAFRKEFKYDPGFYAASTYVNGAVLEAAVKAVNGKVEDKPALMAALRSTNVDTVRGPVKFDDLGNVVGNVYLAKGDAKGRPACQFGIQDLSRCQPVLDLRQGGLPRQSGLFARLSRRPNIWNVSAGVRRFDRARLHVCFYCMLTSVRSMNHDCGETKPLTFGLIARGLRS